MGAPVSIGSLFPNYARKGRVSSVESSPARSAAGFRAGSFFMQTVERIQLILQNSQVVIASGSLSTTERPLLEFCRARFGSDSDFPPGAAGAASLSEHDLHAIAIGNVSKLQVQVPRYFDVLGRGETETIRRQVAPLGKDWKNREAITLATS